MCRAATKCKKDALHKIQNSANVAFFKAAHKGNALLKCNIYAPKMDKIQISDHCTALSLTTPGIVLRRHFSNI